ncbi:helix-turn-helix transcriptional regulator [Deinococcus sp. HMF7604]|uniref:helix-turn-helix domain-containing protein n=1 Tax=Deinococcus betulae TaxID=2873312 RepID=UPI001CCE24C7|nr:helix-turn-helix transcriptional regulator [Deinococcus betulae]
MIDPNPDAASDVPLQKVVGQRIRQLREQQGWSQDTLAHLTGMHRAYPHRIETGQVDVRISTLAKLAEVFGLSLPDLLTFND